MIIVQLKGRLGNQMFQYAFSRNYSLRGHKVFFDLIGYKNQGGNQVSAKFELASLFDVNVPELPKWGYDYFYSDGYTWRVLRKVNVMRVKQVMESDLRYDEAYLHHKGNVWFSGYFQNEKYFSDISEDIRRDFTYIRPVPRELQDVLDAIQRSESVSIHVRRGDFLTSGNKGHGVLPLSYYREAISLVRANMSNSQFFIFTDDPAWVKREFKAILNDYTLVEHPAESESLVDIFLMSQCKHNVTANSSFSWWGAWLNNNPHKLVVAPKRWCVDPVLDVQTSDIVPKRWIRI
jgi:hypothetical protein